MKRRPRIYYTEEQKALMWDRWKAGESIIIQLPTGEQITVAVLGIKGNQVRIGTDAPETITIMREELLEPGPA